MITQPTMSLPESAQGAASSVPMPATPSPFGSLAIKPPSSKSVLAPAVTIAANPYRGPMFYGAPSPAVPSAPVPAAIAPRIPTWVYLAGAGLAVWLLTRRAR